MKFRRYMIATLMACAVASPTVAQSRLDATSSEPYLPRLGDIMNAVQSRHVKLWFGGKAGNWELAAYEIRQIKAGVAEAAVMYEGIPVTNVTTMSKPIQSVIDAIEARDNKRFAKAFSELTQGCNACHTSMARGFVAIQTPTSQPFGNQSFAPQGKP